MKKILLVSHSNYLGGAELCFYETLKVLHDTGEYDITAVFPKQKGQLKEKCNLYCRSTYDLYLPTWMDSGQRLSFVEKCQRLIQIVNSTIKALKLIKFINPELVITNTSLIPQFAFASKIHTAKHIWFIHELVDEDFGYHFIYGKWLSRKLTGCLSDKVITNSKFVNSRYESFVKHEKLVMLYQPVEIKVEQKDVMSESNILELLIVGKVSEYKGQREAILACMELFRRGIQFHLVVLGIAGRDYIEELSQLLPEEVRTCVEFIDFTNNPAYYYRRADIVLVCSRCEALGRITIEAMKIGLPVVASDKGGNLELVQNGVNGYLYKQGDPVDLADKIMLLESSLTRDQFGRNGKKFADENFSLIEFGQKFENLIQLEVTKNKL